MDILLLEWGCANGFRCRGILPEGFGMLRTICEVLDSEDNSKTVVVSKELEPEARFIGADNLVAIEGDPIDHVRDLSPDFDRAFLIAPESHGALLAVSKAAAAHTELMSCPPSTIESLSNKSRVYAMVSETAERITVPRWQLAGNDASEVQQLAADIGFPCVVKPPDGTGSEGISIIRSPAEVRSACAKLKASGWKHSIVQKYVQGKHLSATFIARKRSVLPLSVNTQSMSLSDSPQYYGGSCPYPTAVEEDIWPDLAKITSRGSLEGLMGMDFVLEHGSVHIMEINPRMTTSCIGLLQTIRSDLASALEGSDVRPTHRGYAQWVISPLQRTAQASESLLSRILSLPEVISPPFAFGPFYMKNQSKTLICVSGDDSYELSAKMARAKSALSEMHISC